MAAWYFVLISAQERAESIYRCEQFCSFDSQILIICAVLCCTHSIPRFLDCNFLFREESTGTQDDLIPQTRGLRQGSNSPVTSTVFP